MATLDFTRAAFGVDTTEPGFIDFAAGLGTGLAQQPGGPPAKPAVKALGDQLGDADEAFIRRVSVDLRGKEPTPAEVHFFLASKDANKRATLVDLFVKERVAAADKDRPGYPEALAEALSRELLARRLKAQELARAAEAEAEERAAWAKRMADKKYLSPARAEAEKAKAESARAAAEKAELDAELAKLKDADAQTRQAALTRLRQLLQQRDEARQAAERAAAASPSSPPPAAAGFASSFAIIPRLLAATLRTP